MIDQPRPSAAGAGPTLAATTPGAGRAITGLAAGNGAGSARVYARPRDI
jgi:hypothetical protein